MRLFLDNDTDVILDFDYEKIALAVADAVLNKLDCGLDTQAELLITDNDGIHDINRQMRGIDRPTDVLSFPNLEFDEAGSFTLQGDPADYMDPETGLVMLGSIVVSIDKVLSQAEEYGHTALREYAFLIAHSMLHLCGYDHMTDAEAHRMELLQEEILKGLGITRNMAANTANGVSPDVTAVNIKD